MQEIDEPSWICAWCGARNLSLDYCTNCGEPRTERKRGSITACADGDWPDHIDTNPRAWEPDEF